jgi:predicted phage baseplate assembly protein
VFVVSRSADQTVTTISFGDGIDGARLPSGRGNVVATYRYGSGAASPPVGKLTTISRPQPNLASLRNPVAVAGGADPQAPDDVRRNAPASVLTFGRAISAADYELIASGAPGVARATAYWAFDGQHQRTLVTVYVGDDENAVVAATAALAGTEDPNRPVIVRASTPIRVTVSCNLLIAADRQPEAVVTQATAALSDPVSGLFSPRRMAIGEPLYRSAVSEALMVPGVLAVHALFVSSSEDEVFDPGPGGFYVLAADALAITGTRANG